MRANTLIVALKLLLPSWRFFNDFSSVPRMEFRWVRADSGATDWQPLFTHHTTRSLRRILFNPHGNLQLLERSLVDRAVAGLCLPPDADTFRATELHAALVRMARSHLGGRRDPGASSRFRFRLVTVEPGRAPVVTFTSEEIPLIQVSA